MRKSILDVLESRVGRYPSKANGGPTWFGIWGDTNPMPIGHELYKLLKQTKPPGYAIFEQPSGLAANAENVENLPPGYYARLCNGKDEDWVDEYVRGKYPKRDRGSVYGDLLARLDEAGAMAAFEHPTDGIFPTFDLGISDATAIWWWRLNGAGGVDFIDHYEATGKPLSHFLDELDRRAEDYGWHYRKILLPHDARARTLQTGASVADQFLEKYGAGRLDIIPALSLEDGVSATRWLFERPCRFHPRAHPGLEALRAYRYQFDEDRKVFSRKPLHDWSSHTADSARYAALYVKRAHLLMRPEEDRPRHRDARIPAINNTTWDEAWAEADAMTDERRIG